MIAADEDFSSTTNEKSGDNEIIIATTKIHNDFNTDEDGCSSKLDEKSPESDLDSDSAVSVLNHLNEKSDGRSDDAPSRSSSIQSDKSAIIRLSSELLKAKQSNWEVVDALTSAYDDIRDLRKREQRLNNLLTGNLDNAESTSQADALGSHKATEVKILQSQLEIRGEELSKAKDNIRRLMGERDRLKEECSKTRASLRLLTLQDKRKETEIAVGENNLKSLKEEMREKDDMGLVLKENVFNLEHQLRQAKNSAQKTEAGKEILKDNLKQREDEIIELKRKLKELENEHDLVQSDLSLRTSELARIKSNESTDIFKEIENELAKELNKMELKLIEMKEKSQQDDQTIAEMREKLKEWEKYGSRMSKTMDEYINEVNSQQLEARKEISKYIANLEKELAQVKARQQPHERGEFVDQLFQRNALSRSPRKRSPGKKLPALRWSPEATLPTTSRKMSDSSLSSALDSEGSTEDIGYYHSDVNESDISRPSSSHKGHRRTLPMTPSDIEVLCGDSPEEYFAKQSRKKKQPDRSDHHRTRVFPRIPNNQDSGLGESLRCREDVRAVSPKTTYQWRKKSQERKMRPSSAYSRCGEAADDESDSFPTITPISLDTGSPHSTGAESEPTHKPMKTDITTSSPIKKRNQIPLRRFLSHDRVRAHRRHAALLLVFRYLTPLELCGLAQVCREWRSLSEHPSLWKHVSLVDTAVNNMSLLSISRRCKPLQHLLLKGLKKSSPRKGVRSKADENSCYLEKGLEYILKVSAENMSSIHIEECGNLLTDRCLLLTGSHCRNLQSFTYISDKYPACPEALWALWNCRNLTTLRLPPMVPNEHPKRFNDKSCETIANCWPALTKLSIGGTGITTTGLLHIAKGCLRLQELELDRTHHVTEETAYALCLTGLRGLQILLFTFTTASPGAIKQFYAACPRLEFIAVHVGISDYFSDVTDQENRRKYKRIISKLEALREENSDLARVLRIKADYGGIQRLVRSSSS